MIYGLYPKKQTPIGHQVSCVFGINLHEKDLPLLEKIQSFFKGVGAIHRHGESSFSYIVRSVSDLKIIIEHFESYPLITKKRANYLLFLDAFNLILRKEHLTLEGIKKFVPIKASMNNGPSAILNEAFPDYLPVIIPEVKLPGNIESQ